MRLIFWSNDLKISNWFKELNFVGLWVYLSAELILIRTPPYLNQLHRQLFPHTPPTITQVFSRRTNTTQRKSFYSPAEVSISRWLGYTRWGRTAYSGWGDWYPWSVYYLPTRSSSVLALTHWRGRLESERRAATRRCCVAFFNTISMILDSAVNRAAVN